MDLPALRTIPFLHGNGLAHSFSLLAYGRRVCLRQVCWPMASALYRPARAGRANGAMLARDGQRPGTGQALLPIPLEERSVALWGWGNTPMVAASH